MNSRNIFIISSTLNGAGLSTTLRGMAVAMGSKIKYSDYNIAQLETPAISSLDEVDKLKLINVDEDGRLPIILKGLKMVKERLGDKVPVSGTVTGPFTVASMLVGTENLLKGMVKQPDKVLQMMDIITENNNRYTKMTPGHGRRSWICRSGKLHLSSSCETI